MLIEYIILTFINPLLLIIDYLFDYKQKKEKEKKEKENYIYDLKNDKIKLTYFSNEGEKYIFQFDRKLDINVSNILFNFKKEKHIDFILGGYYNNNKNIIERLKMFFGPNGKHNMYQRLLVKDILNEEEKTNFKSLTIIDEMCEINEFYKLNDYIL